LERISDFGNITNMPVRLWSLLPHPAGALAMPLMGELTVRLPRPILATGSKAHPEFLHLRLELLSLPPDLLRLSSKRSGLVVGHVIHLFRGKDVWDVRNQTVLEG